jgi:hypothetical protein
VTGNVEVWEIDGNIGEAVEPLTAAEQELADRLEDLIEGKLTVSKRPIEIEVGEDVPENVFNYLAGRFTGWKMIEEKGWFVLEAR